MGAIRDSLGLFAVALRPVILLKDYPVLYRGPSLHIVGFGLFAAVSAVVFGLGFLVSALARGLPENRVPDVLLGLPLLAGFVWLFARIVNLLFFGREVLRQPLKHLTATGFNEHGGIVGGILWAFLMSRLVHTPPLAVLDALSLAALLSQAVARIGCYNYGCCYGTPTSRRIAVRYTHQESKVVRVNPGLRGVPIHPTQLYMSAAHLAAFAALAALAGLPVVHGYLTGLFLLYHGLSRLLFERLRGDLHHNYNPNEEAIRLTGRLSTAMVVSGTVLLAVLALQVAHGPGGLPPVSIRPLAEVAALFRQHRAVAAAATGLAAILIFIGYGIHGRRIGVFPFTAPRATD